MYFHPCPLCGANLDPNEKCNCNKTENETGQDLRAMRKKMIAYALGLTEKDLEGGRHEIRGIS